MMSTADAILALVGSVLCALAGRVVSYPSSPVYGRLQRNAVSYPGSGPHSDANYYAVLRDATFGGGSAQAAASPDWGQFLPVPWAGAEAYGAGGMGAVAPVMPVVAGPQYDDYADEYDTGVPAGVEFPAAPNFGYDWYGTQGVQPSLLQQQQQQQLEQEELQEAAVFKDLLANYLTKKSNGASPSERDADRRTASAKKYVPAGVPPASTTAKPNVAATVAAGEKVASAAHEPDSAVTSLPKPTASSLSAPSSRLAEKAVPVPVQQEGGQKEYAMFRPVGTAESRRPSFWPGAAKQSKAGPGGGHGKVTRSRFGRFPDDSLTEELDQLKAQ